MNTSLCYCHVCLQRVNNLKPELTKYFVAFAFITLFSVGTGTAGFFSIFNMRQMEILP